MRCCAAGTNGCLNLTRRAFALDRRASAKSSRCPGSMARRARGSVAPMRRSSAGWMPARVGMLSDIVGPRHPVEIRKAFLMAGSMKWVWALRHQGGALRLNGPGLGWLFAELLLQHPSRSQQATSGAWRVMSASCELTQGVGDTWQTCPTLLRGIWAQSRRAGFRCSSWLLVHV